MSCARIGGHRRRATWRRGRPPAARRAPRPAPRAAAQSPTSTSAPPRRRRRTATPCSGANSAPSGVCGRPHGDRHLGLREPREVARARRAAPRAERPAPGPAPGRARRRRPSRAPPRAGAAARAARTAGTCRAACERSGSRGDVARRGRGRAGCRAWRSPAAWRSRASSACVGQVLLALGAGDLVDAGRARPRASRTAAAARRRSCRRSPGRRGCCRTCRP